MRAKFALPASEKGGWRERGGEVETERKTERKTERRAHVTEGAEERAPGQVAGFRSPGGARRSVEPDQRCPAVCPTGQEFGDPHVRSARAQQQLVAG